MKRHRVKGHTRKGRRVRSYMRGHSSKPRLIGSMKGLDTPVRTWEQFEREMVAHDIVVASDYVNERGSISMPERGWIVYFIQTEDDPSVGMYPVQISPAFKDVDDLVIWWDRHGDKVVREMERTDILDELTKFQKYPLSRGIH